jgi:hypothetical protein
VPQQDSVDRAVHIAPMSHANTATDTLRSPPGGLAACGSPRTWPATGQRPQRSGEWW